MVSNIEEPNIEGVKSDSSAKREMSRKRLIGDGAGQMGMNLFAGFSSVLLYYYTDVAGIAAGLVGTLILISRVFDGFTDLIMGSLLDRTKSKYGKARPWLLWMTLPTVLAAIALFYMPNMGNTGQVIYILVTNALFFSVGLTGLSIAYYSLMALTTRNPYDRSLMGIVRSIFGMAAGMAMSIVFIPLVTSMGGDQKSWSTLIIIISILAGISILVSFKSTKEIASSPEKVEKEMKIPLKNKLKVIFTNKYLVVLLGVQISVSILGVLNASAGIYYAQYIWHNINLIAVIGAAGFLPMIVGFVFIAPLVKRLGKKNVVVLGTILIIIGNLIRLIDPYSVAIGVTGIIIAGLGVIPTMALLVAMISDTIEYGEWKAGLRMEGMVNSGTSFAGKVGSGLGIAGVGWLLALGGYAAGQEIQSAFANQMIMAINIYIPILLSMLIIILLSFYKLDKEYSGIIADLESREK
ncbi:MFS transporter [Sporosarcina sp. FSL K6-3457]|uniref:MFS transporter n=1 Tax=Sporosarcina sp. FSL K6-3457 TaxID=2978204 RepID=UPI0030FAA274